MQFDLGAMYHLGQVVPQNYTEAVMWYRRAADQGSARAQSILGEMYANGDGVPQNDVQAHMWFNLAAATANPVSQKETRDKAVYNCNLVARKMTPAQIAEAQKLAAEWKPKRCKEGPPGFWNC